MRKIKNQYIKELLTLEEACSKLMEAYDMFRGDALNYLYK